MRFSASVPLFLGHSISAFQVPQNQTILLGANVSQSDVDRVSVDGYTICPSSFSLDLQILVDGSAGGALFKDLIDQEFFNTLKTALDAYYPGSRVALSWFQDKPYSPVGLSTDVCFGLATTFTNNAAALSDATAKIPFAGGSSADGNDGETNAVGQAVLSAVQYSEVNWRESIWDKPYGDSGRTNVIKEVVILTHSRSHEAGDGLETSPQLPRMVANNYSAFSTPLDLCKQEDYPNTVNSFTDSMINHNVEFGVVVVSDNLTTQLYWEDVAVAVSQTGKGYLEVKPEFQTRESIVLAILCATVHASVDTCGMLIDEAIINKHQTTTSTQETRRPTTTPKLSAPTRTTTPTTQSTETPTTTPTKTTTTVTTSATTSSAPVSHLTTIQTTTSFSTTVSSATETLTTTVCGTCNDTVLVESSSTPPTVTTVPTTTTTYCTTCDFVNITSSSSSTSSDTSRTNSSNCPGSQCCDGAVLQVNGPVKHVSLSLEWAQRARRLLSWL